MDADTIQTVTNAVLTLVCLRLLWGRRRPAKAPKEPKTICGCKHDFAMHDLRTGECHDTVREPTKFSTGGSVIAWKPVPCTCRHYTGPEPLSSLFQPPPPLPRSTDG